MIRRQEVDGRVAEEFVDVHKESSPFVDHLITLEHCPFCFLEIGNINHGTGAAVIKKFVQEGLTCTSQRDLPWINAMIIQPYFKSGTCMTPFNLHFITINNKAIIIY